MPALERGQPLSPGTLHDALRMTDDAGREVRGIAHAMMPRTLEQLGLAAAMEDLFKRALNGTRTTYALDLLGMEQRMPAAMEVGLYRIIQELVQNTLKHADARQVDVQLLRSRDQVVLHYEDDGIGFGAATGQEGIGLRNIRERVHALGGRLDLHAVMQVLVELGVNELHVETGATLAGALLSAGLVDELLLYVAPVLLGDDARPLFAGLRVEDMAHRYRLCASETRKIGDDLRIRLRPQKKEVG